MKLRRNLQGTISTASLPKQKGVGAMDSLMNTLRSAIACNPTDSPYLSSRSALMHLICQGATVLHNGYDSVTSSTQPYVFGIRYIPSWGTDRSLKGSPENAVGNRRCDAIPDEERPSRGMYGTIV